MDIIFWENMPSHHQSAILRYLAANWPKEVHGVYDTEMLPRRKMQGWKVPNMGKTKLHFLDAQPDPKIFVEDFISSHSDAIHVLGGIRGAKSTKLALGHLLRRENGKLALIAERPNLQGWLGILKWMWYRWFFARHCRKFKVVLAMGKIGVERFAQLGCPRDVLFEFLYLVDSYEQKPVMAKTSVNIHFVYIGTFDNRKGVDLILQVVAHIPPDGWCIDFIGNGGPLQDQVEALAVEMPDRIRCLGTIESSKIIEHLSKYDVCLVPSRHDGWGMMANEALAAGIGTIISDQTASKDLIIASGAGKVIQSDSAKSLKRAIEELIKNPYILKSWKDRARQYRSIILPEPVGQYLMDVIRHSFIQPSPEKPSPPWL